MPIYEYVCRDCGEEVEKLQKLSDAPLTQCPACGESTLKRKISAAGFRLSGGGWYETDFKQNGKRNIAGERKEDAKSGSKGDSESGGKSKSDSKSDSKQSDAKSKTGTDSKSSASKSSSSKPA